jgi:hypothetical protein
MLKTKYAKETTTICCYCAVGCGAIVHTSKKGDGRVINIEGDPDHVINRGSLCSKGAALPVDRKRKPADRAHVPCSLFSKVETGFLGLGPDQNRGKGQNHPGRHIYRKNEKGQVVNRTTASPLWAAPPWTMRSAGFTRPHARNGAGVHRTPGTYLTQRHCCGSGRVVRTRRNDQSLDRYQKQ